MLRHILGLKFFNDQRKHGERPITKHPNYAEIQTPACSEFGEINGRFNLNAKVLAFGYSIS